MKLYRLKDKSTGKYHGGGESPHFREVSTHPKFKGNLYFTIKGIKTIVNRWKEDYEENPDRFWGPEPKNLVIEECEIVTGKEIEIE